MQPRQIPSDITSLDDYIAAHGLPTSDAENPDAPHLRGMRVPGGMSGVVIPMPGSHEAKAMLVILAAKALQQIISELADATIGRECHAYDEALTHSQHLVDQVEAAPRARDEAFRLAAAE